MTLMFHVVVLKSNALQTGTEANPMLQYMVICNSYVNEILYKLYGCILHLIRNVQVGITIFSIVFRFLLTVSTGMEFEFGIMEISCVLFQ